MREALNTNKTLQVTIFLLALILCGFVFARFFDQLPTEGTNLGIDWVHYGIKNGNIHYDITDGLRNPPWSLLPVLWLGFLPEKAGWGVMVYLNLLTLILSVPQAKPRWLYWAAIFYLVTSFPALRTSADGNFEILVTMGALLVVWGYRIKHPVVLAAGILTITAKPQSSFLLLGVLGVYMLQAWSWRDIGYTAAAVLVVVIPMFLWRGQDWLKAVDGTYQRGSIIDISLDAALLRTGIVPVGVRWAARLGIVLTTLYLMWIGQRSISRGKAGLLIAAALLAAPYSAGNSVLAVLAVGIIPFFLADPKRGLILLIMVDAVYFFPKDFRYDYESYYHTLLLLAAWGMLSWQCYRAEAQAS